MGCGCAVCTEGRCEWLCGGYLRDGGCVSLCRLSMYVCEDVAWLRMSVQWVRGMSRGSEFVHMWGEPVANSLLWWITLFFVLRAQSLWVQTFRMRRPNISPFAESLGLTKTNT